MPTMSDDYATTYLSADLPADLPPRVRVWDVYQQRWVEASRLSDRVLASLCDEERAAVLRHLERVPLRTAIGQRVTHRAGAGGILCGIRADGNLEIEVDSWSSLHGIGFNVTPADGWRIQP